MSVTMEFNVRGRHQHLESLAPLQRRWLYFFVRGCIILCAAGWLAAGNRSWGSVPSILSSDPRYTQMRISRHWEWRAISDGGMGGYTAQDVQIGVIHLRWLDPDGFESLAEQTTRVGTKFLSLLCIIWGLLTMRYRREDRPTSTHSH